MIHSEKEEDVVTKGRFAPHTKTTNLSGNEEGEEERTVKNGKVGKGARENLEGFSCVRCDLSLFTATEKNKNHVHETTRLTTFN
jgi:hypothetical protein